MKAKTLPPVEEIHRLLEYNQDTGVFIWRYRGNQLWDSKNAGKVAGSVAKNGYIKIGINNKEHYAHRLAWLYVTGSISELDVDHKNLVRSDNRIDNLRQATRSQNHANRPRCGPLPKGVSRNHARFLAQISIKRKNIYLGTFDTQDQAHAAYLAAATKYYGEFARAA